MSEKELIQSYKKDFFDKTGKGLKLAPCSPWEYITNFTEEIDFNRLVELVCDCTGWERSRLYLQGRSEEKVLRRAVIDFIAVNNGASYLSLAKLTGRNHTTVINSVGFLELRLDQNAHYRRLFKEVLTYVKEYYDLNITVKPALRAV